MERLLAAIDARRDALISLTQDLIRIPTVNPPGENYRDICDYFARRLGPRFEISLLHAEGTPGDSPRYPRWNILARREGARPGQCVHFNSHTDVVEAGQGWTHDPFGGALVGGRIYGRGTCDMKGGLAASIIAAEAFIDTFPDHDGAIEISGTVDEESGGYGGVAWMAERGYFSPGRVQHVIIPEPLHKDRVCLGHRGVWWAEIETKGRIAHGSMPFLGTCALRHMGAVMGEIEHRLIPALSNKTTAMPVVPEAARQSTININSVHGGQPEPEPGSTGLPSPCVPDSARMIIDRRFIMEESLAEVKAEITDLLERVAHSREDFRYSVRDLFEVLPSMTEPDSPVSTALTKAIGTVLGRAPEYVASPGTYDQKHIDRIGRLKNCVAYGPGLLELAHQPDEYVEVDDMLDSAKVMALALHDLLNGPA
ncbi:acetylornithine deacetylase/succinyl-diaminopimelate desuccinylase family protein [Oceanicella sp. SM1341]|uniref:acetylornithine deacetylase/succinyl-diaminopimelate desuccinylase family protein n=1 Tax=Oceanicella sp. SM1341 TaxID=1548889 RepID=UPI000E518B27|nr:acetylornithine deacetylase/succinyl-diaminopimelate desuccinylase family protein [Oceanicella sp. SM1341]